MSTGSSWSQLLGSCTALLSIAAVYQHQSRSAPPTTPGRGYTFRYRLETRPTPIEGAIPIQVSSPSAPTELDQVISLPRGAGSIRLKRFLPRAAREQVVEPDEGGSSPPAVQISIDGPGQSNRAWLVADDPARNRLTSLIAAWRYAAVSDDRQRDALFEQFERELTRPAVVSISRTDGSGRYDIPAKSDTEHDLKELGCRVRVKRFLPHFGMDKTTRQAVNQSDKRLNPAALVEIEYQGRREERWVFARFPDFKTRKSGAAPFDVRLDCPVEPANPLPGFVLVTVGGKRHELWSRSKKGHVAAPLRLEEKIPIPGTNLTFHLARFIPSGRLVETYRPADRRASVTVLEMEFTGAREGPMTMYLEVGSRRVVETQGTTIIVELVKESAGRGHDRLHHPTP